MSSLTQSLLIFVGLAAALVLGYNLWVLQREKRRVEAHRQKVIERAEAVVPMQDLHRASETAPEEALKEATGGNSEQAPMGEHPPSSNSSARKVEESLDADVSHASPISLDAISVSPHRTDEAAVNAKSDDDKLTQSKGGFRVLHDEADCLIDIPLPQPSSGDRLIQLTKSIRRAGGKPVAFEGQPLNQALDEDGKSGRWEGLQYGVSYRALRAGILLSNRQGALNAMEYSELGEKLQPLAAQLGSSISMPVMEQVLQRARSLDALLADCDVQVGLAVECAQALSTQDLAVFAKRLGLFERGNNRYAALSELGEVVYSVALGDKTNRLQFQFDIPRVVPAYKPWWGMAEAAHQAAVLFDGKIVDDAGQELSEQSFRNVAIQLEGRQAALHEAGVPAGSTLALRVFN